VNEAIVLQDSTEQLLSEIRDESPLGHVAPRGGPVIRRFEALRDELPSAADPALRRYVDVLDRLLHHHAMVLSTALDLLTVSWRSERLLGELHRISDLGIPGRRLEELKARLDERLAEAQ